jgi:D-tyrosyl-tRNA(Tyr) deacylase
MFFAEVGSSERQWVDKDVCRYLIEAILRGTASQSEAPIGIGFGGGHYCPKFSIMEKEIAFGHIAAKYALIELTEDTIGQMISKTSGNISRAYIEDSVKGFERKKVEVALDKLNLESQVI